MIYFVFVGKHYSRSEWLVITPQSLSTQNHGENYVDNSRPHHNEWNEN